MSGSRTLTSTIWDIPQDGIPVGSTAPTGSVGMPSFRVVVNTT
ncbi:hypothetical protein [Trueperella sp. LYQ143]